MTYRSIGPLLSNVLAPNITYWYPLLIIRLPRLPLLPSKASLPSSTYNTRALECGLLFSEIIRMIRAPRLSIESLSKAIRIAREVTTRFLEDGPPGRLYLGTNSTGSGSTQDTNRQIYYTGGLKGLTPSGISPT